MSEQNLGDQPSNIQIKRPFIARTIKELERQQMDFNRKLKKKQRKGSINKLEELASRYQISTIIDDKAPVKLQEITRNGNRIIAEWKNDQIQGFAQIFYQNGIHFKGIYQNGIKVKGHFKFKSGFQYIGNCFGNKFQGEGTLRFPNGKTIEGEWKDFEIIGNGKISYPKGEVYYGEIKQFKKHGTGYFYFTDGSKYEGEFRDGLITGKGSYYVQGNLVSTGIWFNGQLQEQQTLDNQKLELRADMNKTIVKKDQNQIFLKDFNDKKTFYPPSKTRSKKNTEEEKEIKRVHFN